MELERAHGTTQQSAMQKIDEFLDGLMKRQFRDVKISNPWKEWERNVMRFSFKVSKGWTWTKIQGSITVNQASVQLEAEMGVVARQLVSEELVEKTVNEQFEKLFFSKD